MGCVCVMQRVGSVYRVSWSHLRSLRAGIVGFGCLSVLFGADISDAVIRGACSPWVCVGITHQAGRKHNEANEMIGAGMSGAPDGIKADG